MRAYWDGTQFLSRNGNRYFAPTWFTAGLPTLPLDGELWIGRRQFQGTVSLVRQQDAGEAWRQLRFVVFDAPQSEGPFENRLAVIRDLFSQRTMSFTNLLDQSVCRDRAHLDAELARIEALGGEGLMLRQPGSLYVPTRSTTLLKVKPFQDGEAVVIGHQPGTGRHRGRLGALIVRLARGVECAVGTGFSDTQRERPPAIGAVITLKFQELTDAGVPRFPVFVRVRDESPARSLITLPGESFMRVTHAPCATRRFEFVDGSSRKYWEVCREGSDVVIRFGRIGTGGQGVRKPFRDVAAADKQIEKLIREKTGKGYVEVHT